MKSRIMKALSVFFVFLMISMAFIPAVSAQVELKQNQLEPVPSQKEIEKFIRENTTTLKKTATEEITEIRTEKSIIYTVTWVDETDSSKINIAFIPQDELIDSGYLNARDIKDNDRVSSAASKAKVSFSRQSYAQNYGNVTNGGIHVHFSEEDALLIRALSALAPAIGGAIGTLLGGVLGAPGGPLAVVPAAALKALGTLVGVCFTAGVIIAYSYGKNSDGSIDLKMSYASIYLKYIGLPGILQVGSYSIPI